MAWRNSFLPYTKNHLYFATKSFSFFLSGWGGIIRDKLFKPANSSNFFSLWFLLNLPALVNSLGEIK